MNKTQLEINEIDDNQQPWQKHKINAETVSSFYKNNDTFKQYGERIDKCSEILNFQLIPNIDQDELLLKLTSAQFCRVRNCPICQWRRSLKWKAKMYQILPEIINNYANHRWLFITLTVRNCEIENLKKTIQWMNKSWQRLSQLKQFPALGWLKSMEVTKGKNYCAHPHFHCLLMVKPSYFGKNYIKQCEWVEMWKKSLRINYSPIVDIRTIKKEENLYSVIPEIIKYCVKESDLISDQDWFLELTNQLHNTRAISAGGIIKEYLKNHEKSILKNENQEESNNIYFYWDTKYKKYNLIL